MNGYMPDNNAGLGKIGIFQRLLDEKRARQAVEAAEAARIASEQLKKSQAELDAKFVVAKNSADAQGFFISNNLLYLKDSYGNTVPYSGAKGYALYTNGKLSGGMIPPPSVIQSDIISWYIDNKNKMIMISSERGRAYAAVMPQGYVRPATDSEINSRVMDTKGHVLSFTWDPSIKRRSSKKAYESQLKPKLNWWQKLTAPATAVYTQAQLKEALKYRQDNNLERGLGSGYAMKKIAEARKAAQPVITPPVIAPVSVKVPELVPVIVTPAPVPVIGTVSPLLPVVAGYVPVAGKYTQAQINTGIQYRQTNNLESGLYGLGSTEPEKSSEVKKKSPFILFTVSVGLGLFLVQLSKKHK